MTLRRAAALVCSVALVVALCFAALHRHELGGTGSSTDDAGCVYCSGGMVAAQAPAIVPAAERVWSAESLFAPEAPALKRRIPLSQSGNAPPA